MLKEVSQLNNYAKRMNYQVSTAAAADIGTPRSKFYMPHTRKTTFNVGDLIPVGAPIPILPGDSIDDFDTKVLARLSTAKFPTMDNAFVDFFAFFTPWRLLFDKTKEFFGENNESAWVAPDPVLLPHVYIGDIAESGAQLPYSLWDYFGLPVGSFDGVVNAFENEPINVMPFRGYKLIYNEFFRNQNTTPPLMVNTTASEMIDADYLAIQRGCRLHDLYSDCLPAPQKGVDVIIPGLTSAPVITSATSVLGGVRNPLRMKLQNGNAVTSSATLALQSAGVVGATLDSPTGINTGVYPDNLVLDASAATIRSLRDAFQIQRIYERDARSGSRYTEYLRAAFDVVSPDASLQRPQFLGTYRLALSMSQVIQNSSSVDGSPLGNVAGLSKTWGSFRFPAQGFTEHGYLYILALARTERSYYGGIHPMFTQLSRFDVYDPALGMISEQPVYKRELSAIGDVGWNEVFGYKPPWEELRSIPSWVSGSFRPDAAQSLADWTYVDYYGDTSPTLSTEWMEESDANMARTLAYNSETQRDQILLDMRCDWKISRCLPIKGIPGLVDHF